MRAASPLRSSGDAGAVPMADEAVKQAESKEDLGEDVGEKTLLEQEPEKKHYIDQAKEEIPGLIVLAIVGVLLALLGIFLWKDFTWEAWVVVALIVFVCYMLARNYSPDVVLLFSLCILMVTEILTPREALAGFAEPTVFAIAMLLIIARGLELTGALDLLGRLLVGTTKNRVFLQLRLLIPSGIVSMFLNNTPVVAMMIPIAERASRKTGVKVSKLLMPLSFISILGGVCTLIGTSTNLLVVSLARQKDDSLSIGFFEVGYVGLPLFTVGLAYIVVMSRWLLRDKSGAMEEYLENSREYNVSAVVVPGGPAVNLSVEEARLRHLEHLFLFGIERNNGEYISAPNHDVVLQADDILYFCGKVEGMRDLLNVPGIRPVFEDSGIHKVARPGRRVLVEAVVASSAPYIGKSVKSAKFRTIYGAAIIAVHRYGHRLSQKIGDIYLKPGDTLLLVTRSQFVERFQRDTQHFALVSIINQPTPERTRLDYMRIALSVLLLVAMVGVTIPNVVTLSAASSAVVFAMLITRILTVSQARASVNSIVLITIAAAFGLGKAMDTTGVAAQFGETLLDLLKHIGDIGILTGLYIATAALSSVVTNAAAVAVMFPIGYEIVNGSDGSAAGSQNSVDGGSSKLTLKAVTILLMLGASSSFSTPVGYQTNLMVVGPGGYTMGDFLKFGLPLQVIALVISVGGVYLLF
eukprot:CAMPEP_0177634462 /NCGR_PEP_ID=MMETSP0447-20121125/3381_1 /TAXON_ID=0 /ORGANISM="Stygamoeba regulata, Strain BSH-02190019" /LENGTH=693 /DNA_ID=CAMNT_0019136185 /DNA_START=27 /DNA_END=2108 /DNA_ORIENTATION=-